MKLYTTGGASSAVPWSYPWYAPWRALGGKVELHLRTGAALWEALNQCGAAPVRFVPHTDLPPGFAYEQFIAQTDTCPTRESPHDFFNGLCWINWPATKKKLNLLQSAQIALNGTGPLRGPVRDALTILDENAAFLQAPNALWEALLAKQWRALFVDLRPLWRDARLILFGHALLDKLQRPRKAICAHLYRVDPATDSLADMDRWVARDLDAEKLSRKPFAPLPVLGVPGWWAANEDFGFYQDPAVFRLQGRVIGRVQ